MNPLINNLRVAVVPSEMGYDINQSSTVEEILQCSGTELYAITDYFKAQNDEELPAMHWSFLIDVNTKTDWTGCNIDGVHCNIRIENKMEILNLFHNGIKLKWNDPDSIEGNDYIITAINYIDEEMAHIEYNGGKSHAEVFLTEISMSN